MKKFNVRYVAYDNHEFNHRNGNMIIEAETKEEANQIIRSKSNWNEEFYSEMIEEITEDSKNE